METPKTPSESTGEKSTTSPSFWLMLLDKYPEEIGGLLKGAGGLIAWFPRQQARQRLYVTSIFSFILLVAVGFMFWLTFSQRISGETMAFFVGALVGYIFAFLNKYLGIV